MATWRTINEAIRILDRSRRAIHGDIKNGCPSRRDPDDRRRWQIDVDAHPGWLRQHRTNTGAPVTGDERAEVAATTARTVIAEIQHRVDAGDANADTLIRMARDAANQEKIALEMLRAAATSEDITPAGLRSYQQIWTDLVNARRQLEKELPEILHKKERYVDRDDVAKILTRAWTAMCSELDQAGVVAAGRFDGDMAKRVKVEVDDAVRRARRHAKVAIEKIIQGTSAE